MNKTHFKYISLLLASALICIMVVQVIWVSTLVNNSKKNLIRVFTEALNNASAELQREEDIKLVGKKVDNFIGEKLSKHHLNKIVVSTTTRKNEISDQLRDTAFTIIKVDTATVYSDKKIIIKKVENYGGGSFTDSTFTKVTISDSNSRLKGRVQNLDSLVKQLVLDFESREIDITERTDTSSINRVLKSELLKKGLNIGFEFGVLDANKLTPIASAGYKPGNEHPLTPLFTRDVYRKKNFLEAYPTNVSEYIWSDLKIPLLLTLTLTLLILIIFIITFRAILNQKKISEIKNDFINNMTHELKTPIATISLAIDAINNPLVKKDTGKLDNYTQILKEENKKLNSHVERVLQVALLDKGELALDKKDVVLNNIVASAINSYKLQMEKQHAILKVSGDTDLHINGDEFHLGNAFGNLIDNALKYSTEKCEINIIFERKGEHILVHIKDNGIGMDSTVQKKVFEKFYRAEGGNLHSVKGFGLGLNYVRSIIEAHGGTIELKSEKGKGSKFIIKLKS